MIRFWQYILPSHFHLKLAILFKILDFIRSIRNYWWINSAKSYQSTNIPNHCLGLSPLISHYLSRNSCLGTGCGSVGRVVASDNKGPWFEYSHWQTFYYLYTVNCIEQTKVKKKTPCPPSLSHEPPPGACSIKLNGSVNYGFVATAKFCQ